MKPLKEIVFRPMQGVWQDVAGESGTLADTLQRLNIIIDDKTQFARFKDYTNNRDIWYRAYNHAKITIAIWKINEEY